MAPRNKINKDRQMMQAFCLRQVHNSSQDSSCPRTFTYLWKKKKYVLLMWHSEPKKGLQFPKKWINLWSTWILFEYNVTKHKKSMPHASNNKRKENKNMGTKTTCALIDSGLLKHKRICSDPSITELNLQKKSWLMEFQHVVKALMTNTYIC